MLDIKLIRENKAFVEEKLKQRKSAENFPKLCELDDQLRDLKTKAEQLKAKRNLISKKIGELKQKGEDATEAMQEVASISSEIKELDKAIAETNDVFKKLLATFPNLAMDDVLVSDDPKDNIILKEVGQKRVFTFPHKNHIELNAKLDLFDFRRGAKVTGSGWPIYKNLGARLEWALIDYMLEMQQKNGFIFWWPPALVRSEILFGSGQLPKFENQQYKIDDKDYDFYLIPTAEVPLNGLHFDEILEEKDLPLKYCAYTPCFRREAGAAGKQERGLIRMHQFNKVELFCFTKPEDSMKVFDMMVHSAESILEGLGLHYRNVLLVTGDMGFSAARTVDIEVFLPGQDRYYEVSSISNCTDFQARRSNIRYRPEGGKPEFVHTLNGSGLATSRLMVALLENNQNEDGTVNIPEVLQKRMGGLKKLG